MNGYEAKVQTTAKYIKFDAWARTGTKRCNAKKRPKVNGSKCKNAY